MFYLKKIIEKKIMWNIVCLVWQQKSLITQLRLGSLPIHIETGRLCDTQEVEDEIHFVCKCNLYITISEK